MHRTSKNCISSVGFDYKFKRESRGEEGNRGMTPPDYRTPHSVTEGQRVLCLLNFTHAYDIPMQVGNLVENQGFLCLLIFPCMLMREN